MSCSATLKLCFVVFLFTIQLSAPSLQSDPNKITNRNKINSRPSHFSDYPDQPEIIRSFLGAPSSCQDLLQLGHQISGFYLVKGLNNKGTKIETVFCEFNLKNYPDGEVHFNGGSPILDVQEFRYGYIDVYSSPRVSFYVQKTETFSKLNSIVPFELETLNVGNAINLKTGVFTAPKSGIYHFSFAGIKDTGATTLVVYMRKNKETIGKAIAADENGSLTLVMEATLKLKEGDTIDLYKTTGDLYDDKDGYTHFTGWIIEEDLNSITEQVTSKPSSLENQTLVTGKFNHIVPSNCQDLKVLGHKLSGFYLIRQPSEKITKISTIYCDFAKEDLIMNYPGKIYGYANIYSFPRVFFYAQKKTSFNLENSIVPFEIGLYNVGDAMNLASGIFTAPKPGTYYFSFTAIKNNYPATRLMIFLRLNGAVIAQASASDQRGLLLATMTSTLKLKQGDTVDLFKTTGHLYEDSTSCHTHFTGLLLEEDSTIITDVEFSTKIDRKKVYSPRLPFSNYPDKPEEIASFKEVPSNCHDLQLLGYKHNGVYLVKGINDKATKIETIYCDFNKNDYTEKRYGYINIHSSPRVFFYLQKKQSLSIANSIIPFEIETLNVGGAMNSKNGVFTAPISGIYHFSFTAIKKTNSAHDWFVVYLRKNGNNIGQAFATSYEGSFTTALKSTLKLQAGDKIDLYKIGGLLFDDEKGRHTHFTGWLIEEDTIIF